MPRVATLKLEDMNAAQRALAERIAARRGSVRGPFAVWIRSAPLAERVSALGEHVRWETSLAPRLSELAVLVVARHWTAQFPWVAHEKEARNAGLAPAVIEAIKTRRRPVFQNTDEAAVYDFVTELQETRSVRAATYDQALAALGETALVELVGILGYYTLVALTVNAFEVPVPEGVSPPLPV